MTNAVIYTRYSSALQNENSIDAQLKLCRAFCEQRGFTVVDEYIDRAESASTTKRTDFQRMMTDMRARRFEVVVTHKLDRLSRSVTDILLMMKEFKERECRYVSATEQLDLTTPFGMMILVILAWFAEWYLINLRGEIAKGKHERAVKGQVNASILPFGYTREKIGEEKTVSGKVRIIYRIAIDENGAHVRWAFQQYASGHVSYLDIATEFNRLGLITQKGGRWNSDNVREMVSNPFYAGLISERGMLDKATASGTRRRVPRAERKLHQGLHEPLITQELFDECTAIRTRRWHTTQGRRPKRVERYLLGGIAYCSHCGRRMRAGAREDGSYPNYMCVSHRLNYPCDAQHRYVAQHELEPQADALIASLALPERYKADAIKQLSAKNKSNSYDKRLKSLQAEQGRLNLMFQKSVIDEDYYDGETRRIKAEIASLSKPVDVPSAIKKLHQLVELWGVADEVEHSTIMRILVKRAVIDPDTKRVVHWEPQDEFAAMFEGIEKTA